MLEFFTSEAYAQVPATIIKLYIAAFNGDSLLVLTDVTDLDYGAASVNVEIEVPAGSGRDIVVLAEDKSGRITYYGKNDTPLDLASGDVTSVDITMKTIYNTLGASYNFSLSREEWEKITGASGYNVYYSGSNLVQSGMLTYYAGFGDHSIEVVFDFIGTKSTPCSYYFGC